MLWNVRHRWTKASRLAFNCYRHHGLVVVRGCGGKPAYIIPHKDGVSQGDPLAMALYGVALLPLAEGMEKAVPKAVTPQFMPTTPPL
jgi:hypothetical protein